MRGPQFDRTGRSLAEPLVGVAIVALAVLAVSAVALLVAVAVAALY